MRYIFFVLLTTLPSQCYIHSMVKLWDINKQNQSRSIDLLGDWHEEGPANQSQFTYLEKLIEKRKDDTYKKPLHVLIEDPILPNNLFLSHLADYGRQPRKSDKLKIENIDTRAALIAASWLLMHDDPRSDLFQSLKTYDRDSEYVPHDLTFQDISIAFDRRKQQIKDMCKRLDCSISHFSSELADAHRSFDSVQTNLKKWEVDKSDRVATVSDEWLKNKLTSRRESVKIKLVNSFTKLCGVYATLYIKTIPYDYDVLLCTGSNNTWFITPMLKRLGAWHIDEYQNSFALQGNDPVSEDRLQMIQEPKHTQSIRMRLATLSHCVGIR